MTRIDDIAGASGGRAGHPRDVAALSLSLLDLTDLSEGCDAARIDTLCARSRTPFGDTAAICIWPGFVAQARGILGAGHPVKIATVVNFPSGGHELGLVAEETCAAIADGADEIDLVLPYRALMAGDASAATAMVEAIRTACATTTLKVILESGLLNDPGLIASATDLAIRGRADMVKTSTGKVAVNATLDAADVMLREIRRSGRRVGFKAAGGIQTVALAGRYLRCADAVMGGGWVTPATFRFGASSLLDDILAVLDGRPSTDGSPGY